MRCRPLSREEVASLLPALPDNRYRLLLLLGVVTGFRISELLSITKRDLVDGVLTIPAARTKNKIGRSITLPDQLFLALFYSSTGRKSRLFDLTRVQVWRIFKRTAISIGLDSSRIGTHSLRKTFAGRVFEQHRSVDTVKFALAHRDVGSTLRYIEGDDGTAIGAILDTVDWFGEQDPFSFIK